jgi:hypothetical protein
MMQFGIHGVNNAAYHLESLVVNVHFVKVVI